mgnify:CR=1 FL=1
MLTRPRFLVLVGAGVPLFILLVQLTYWRHFDFPHGCSAATAALDSASSALLDLFALIDGLLFVLLAWQLHRFADDGVVHASREIVRVSSLFAIRAGFGVRFEFRVIGGLVALSLISDVLLPTLGIQSSLTSAILLLSLGVVFVSVMTIWCFVSCVDSLNSLRESCFSAWVTGRCT